MNYADVDKSKRLQRFLGVLADGLWHGTREIVHRAEIMAVNSVAAEVRANGIKIETRCVGQGRYEYRLLPRPMTMPTEQLQLPVAA